jgi:hypothetical protein
MMTLTLSRSNRFGVHPLVPKDSSPAKTFQEKKHSFKGKGSRFAPRSKIFIMDPAGSCPGLPGAALLAGDDEVAMVQ